MERLNEIFDRTGRRQPVSEQRSQSRAPLPHGSLTRRFATDPQARSEPSYQSPTRSPLRSRNYAQDGEHLPSSPENRSYGTPITRTDSGSRTDHPTYPPYQSRRSVVENTPLYQTIPQPHQDQPRIQPLQPRPTNDYYQMHASDTYTPNLQADTVEEWDEDGMGYGDWEKNGGNYFYEDEEADVFDEQSTPYQPSNYRQSPALPSEPPVQNARLQTQTRHHLHDTRLASALATQQARTHDVPSQQRITQPLNPQSVPGIAARLSERHSLAKSTPPPPSRYLKPVRQDALPALPQEMQAPAQQALSSVKSVCSKCRGAGYLRSNVPFGHPNFGKPIACECKEAERKEKRRLQLRDMSNMDAFRNQSFRSFSLNAPGLKDAYEAAVSFAQDPEGWLVFVGPNGCGKTHLAAAIANLSLDNGAVVLFEAVPDLLDHLRAAFAPTATEVFDQLFSKMREAELLVLDDLGAQQSSPWANEKLFQLLNYRYNMSMPTVITANPKGLQGIDERIRSRLGDQSLVTHIAMNGARDFRPQNTRKR